MDIKVINDYQDGFDIDDPSCNKLTKENLDSHLYHVFAGYIDFNSDNIEKSDMYVKNVYISKLDNNWSTILLVYCIKFKEYYVLNGKEFDRGGCKFYCDTFSTWEKAIRFYQNLIGWHIDKDYNNVIEEV